MIVQQKAELLALLLQVLWELPISTTLALVAISTLRPADVPANQASLFIVLGVLTLIRTSSDESGPPGIMRDQRAMCERGVH